MKGSVRKVRSDQRGNITVFFLIMMSVFLSALVFSVNYVQAVTESDIDVQRGLEQAVKAAALVVTDDSRASGRPKIHTAKAHEVFREVLAANLGLDKDTLSPLPSSIMKNAPNYVLVIYNGTDDFSGGGALRACKYRFNGGELSEEYLDGAGFPYRFGVTPDDVIAGGGGTYSVTLDMPGAVAVIKASVVKVFGRDPILPERYAAAKLVCPDGACGP